MRCRTKTNATEVCRLRRLALAGLCLLLLVAAPSHAELDPGSADRPNRTLPQWLNQQLSAGAKKVTIPPGRYYVAPYKKEHLRLSHLRDVEIIANDVELVCTQTTRAISIANCNNLTIRGLTIDYDPLPFTQGRIVELSGDKRRHTIQLFDGYPRASAVKAWKYEIFDGDTEALKTYTYHGIGVDKLGDNRLRVTKPSHYLSDMADESVGDIVVIASEYAPDGSIPHAVFADNCVALEFDGVTVYSSTTFGFAETNCVGSEYRGCVVDRRPPGDDLKPRGHRRLRSLNADAFHSKHAIVGPIYKSCVAKYMGDDGIAINTDYHLVVASEGNALRIVAKNDGPPDLKAGDRVELITHDGRRLEPATVRIVQSAALLTADEKRFIAQEDLIGDVKRKTARTGRAYYVELDRDVELMRGSVIGSADRKGDGFKVIDCEVGPNRSRGIIVKAGQGVIAGNTLRDNWGEAIKVAPEFDWLEAGATDRLLIENNTILAPRSVAIAVYAIAGNGEVAPAGLHRDITLRNNRITGAPTPAIYITSTLGVAGGNNVIDLDSTRELLPWVANKMGVRGVEQKVYTRNTRQ
ncbi:MAG: right-handed parallel beta-helix repeat-containing protein [Phycisphaeraceae bacterium]